MHDLTEERMGVVSLREVVDALDLQSDELRSCLDPETGEIITFNREEERIARNGDWASAPDWMREALPKVKRALEDHRILELPDRVHIDEWRMMQDFAEQQEPCRCRPELASAATGTEAFRHFHDAVLNLGLEDAWRRYRVIAYERVARQWLEENNIVYR